MPKWTDEQLKAITLKDQNIIVSAGAGSGKTTVLTERVLRHVLNNISVNNLLVLTFTNKAAKEMKDRIKKALTNNNMLEEAEKIESSYITTFDSFALSLVKKYSDYLNITSNIKITDDAIIDLKKEELLDNIMDSHYQMEENDFKLLINHFCLKDDKELKELLLKCYKKLELLEDKNAYLDDYLNNKFQDENISKDIELYEEVLRTKISYIKEILERLSLYFDGTYMEKLYTVLNPLLNSNTYDEIIRNISIKLPSVPKNTDLYYKNLKASIKDILNDIAKLAIYTDKDDIYNSTKEINKLSKIIITIIKELDRDINKYKVDNDIFNFNDIAKFAIKLVLENASVRDEVKSNFKEILIDEYQDTNDIQEKFISLIANNNVYMVGDIKQSIYRFRNANPYIFKSKYDLYSNSSKGLKIDLNRNFRSREEVINNINEVFSFIMDDNIGGAHYKKEHQMIYGNKVYSDLIYKDFNYNMNIYTYKSDESKKISDEEQEIFIIANDIKEKVNNHIEVFDKENGSLRKIAYSDFAILIDRATSFDTYKKIFEYLEIPLTLTKDDNVLASDDIYIFKNLLKLVVKIKNKEFDNEFKYAYLSLGRSYLCSMSDQQLFIDLTSNKYKESIIFKNVLTIIDEVDYIPCFVLFEKLLEIFKYDECLTKITNIDKLKMREEYIYNLIKELSDEGKTVYDIVEVLEKVIEKSDIKLSLNSNSSNAVNIMTIHKSKGLEFPICYFSGFTKEFNFSDLKEKLIFDKKYGFIYPTVDELRRDSIYKLMLKDDYKKEEVSEKIRLLYVALTRAREKMIIVVPDFIENEDIALTTYEKLKYKSFYDILLSISNILPGFKTLKESNVNKNYLYLKTKIIDNLKINTKLTVTNLDIVYELLNEERYSKNVSKLNSKEELLNMEIGTKIHEIFEYLDFKNPDLNIEDKFIKSKTIAFLNTNLIKNNKEAKFYHEYEFINTIDNNTSHGIIDLLIENDNEIFIVDYKLKHVTDKLYEKQLLGYKSYIERISNKPVRTYLYSIMDEKLIEIF